MKRPMSRGEWLLISAPLILFGGFAALYARWKALAPAVLNPSPVPLVSVVPIYDGRTIVGLGEQVDALNHRVPGTPWQILLWNAKDGHLRSLLRENRTFYNWNFSRDGELLALHIPGIFNLKTKKSALDTIVVLRTADGSEVASWTTSRKSSLWRSISFSPDNREIITVDERLERYDLTSGKLIAALDADKIFSGDSRFDRISFSPDGRLVVAVEGALYFPRSPLSDSTTVTSVSTSAEMGGRMVVLAFPSLRPIMHPQGDLYGDCSWESNERFWGVATLLSGYKIQKLVRARIDLKTKQTSLEALELPPDYSSWDRRSLSINAPTGQIVLAGAERAVIWGRNGQIETSFNFSVPAAPKGGSAAPGVYSVPRFSRDGRSLFHVNENNVERYDLSRFLPEPTSAQTSSP